MLKALKKRLAPTDEARILEVEQKYQRLKKYNKREKVDKWLKDWETTYTDAKELQLPEVAGNRPQNDFTRAISGIDLNYASTQDYILNEKIQKGEALPDLYDLVERFRNKQRKDNVTRDTSSHTAFTASLRGETQDEERSCLCGGKHGESSRWDDCEYITPKRRPSGWKGKPEIFEKINRILKKWESGKRNWFIEKFKYDGWKDSKKESTTDKETLKLQTSMNKDKEKRRKKSKASKNTESQNDSGSESESTIALGLITHSSFQSRTVRGRKLYNSWTLDNASDIHVCNDPRRSSFRKTREAAPGDRIVSGSSACQIKAYGTVKLNIETPRGRRHLELTNVALAPGFMSNLVSLNLLNIRDVHWNSEHPEQITHKGELLCNLEKVDSHWVFERNALIDRMGNTATALATAKKSKKERKVKLTAARLHHILGHPSPDVIKHIEKAVADVTVDHSEPAPSTINCETCSVSKATQVISRRTEVDEPENGIPFDRMTWDMVGFNPGYNGH